MEKRGGRSNSVKEGGTAAREVEKRGGRRNSHDPPFHDSNGIQLKAVKSVDSNYNAIVSGGNHCLYLWVFCFVLFLMIIKNGLEPDPSKTLVQNSGTIFQTTYPESRRPKIEAHG